MARLWTGGAEWADGSAEGLSIWDNTDIQSTTVRSGSRAWRFNTLGRSSITNIAGVTGTGYYGRGYLRVASVASVDFRIIGFFVPGVSLYHAKLKTNGTLQFYFDTTPIGSPSGVLTAGTWYRVEVFQNIGAAGSDDSGELRVDGVTIASESAQTRSTSAPTRFGFGDFDAIATGFDVYFDDCAVNDSTGASQNSWPGSGSVVLLRPTADSAVGTGWTLGTGTAIAANSGSTAVKNAPPVGVADLAVGSDTKQIRNASANANVNYDATMTTYTAAGAAAGATVNVVVPIIATAAPVVTSAKAGTVGVVSNPTIANIALGAGGTSGAFWSGVAANTYPTGWKWSFGTTTYAPSVTLGTAPVMRVTQVTSSTRIADVCAMGIYVDYTPAAPKSFPIQARTARNMLLRR